MALSVSTIQPTDQPVPSIHPSHNDIMASILSMVMLTVIAGQKSRKELRKIKRRMTWLLLKQKLKNAFSISESDRKLIIYILLGLVVLILLFTYPYAALVLAIVALVLLLTGTI